MSTEANKITSVLCFDCGSPAPYRHHVVPKSLGGTATVPLCGGCHAKAHGANAYWKTSELTKKTLAQKRAKQEKTGGAVPFGFEVVDNMKLIPKPEEFDAIKFMHALRQQGRSLREIAAILTREGVATKMGNAEWHHNVVREILNRTIDFTCEASL